jgi:uncharacterized protein (DUF1015 family)
MAHLRPFRALRPRPESAARVAAVPYDVVDRQEAAELAAGNPLSFLHVSRAEIGLPAQTDPYSSEVYEKARANLERLIESAPLMTEDKPCLYLYRLEINGHAQTGLAGTFSVAEYADGRIRRHELTRQQKEDDRTRHLRTLQAQTGPVFLAYRARSEIDEASAEVARGKPEYDFTAVDGVRHTLWVIRETERWVELFGAIPRLYIADGHHRAASASRMKQHLSKNAEPENFKHVLAVAFPSDQLKILPYHRLIKDLNGHGDPLVPIRERFEVTENAPAAPTRRGEFAMYYQRRWWKLTPKRMADSLNSGSPPDAVARLDVSILQKTLLEPVFGIRDPRTDQRIDFVGGSRGTKELERKVDSGEAVLAFSMYPTSMDELFEVSDADQIMPPKSTWFEPKLRDGLLSHWI